MIDQLKKIQDFCKIGSGTTPSRQKGNDYYGGSIPWVKSGELRETIIELTEESVTDQALRDTSLTRVPRGALLVAMYGATVGRVGILGIEATTNQAVCHIIPDSSQADSRYLFHALQNCTSEFLNMAVGGAQPNISQQVVKNTKIFLPPLPEQRRIAAILDQADALRAKRRKALAKVDEMAQAIFLEMFGDPQDNAKKWQTSFCSELCQRINVGVVIKPASHYCDAGVPAIRGTNIKPNGIDLTDLVYFSKQDSDGPLSKSRLCTGDLVIVRTGQPGLAAIVPPELNGANAIDVIIVTPKTEHISPVFMRELLNSDGGKQMILKHSRGQVQQHFNVGSLSSAELIVPPIGLQEQFESRVRSVSKLRLTSLTSLEEYNSLFASLQNRAFSGAL